MNGLTNTGVPDVPLIIDQVKSLGVFYSSSKTVKEFSSNSDGAFSESPRIDSTMFQNKNILILKVKENSNYMTLPKSGTNYLHDLTRNPFNSLNIIVYPKVSLTIKLNRNQNDNFDYFAVSYYFVDNEEFFPFSILPPQGINKSELIGPTSADTYTKIRVTKRNSSGVSTATLDSINA